MLLWAPSYFVTSGREGKGGTKKELELILNVALYDISCHCFFQPCSILCLSHMLRTVQIFSERMRYCSRKEANLNAHLDSPYLPLSPHPYTSCYIFLSLSSTTSPTITPTPSQRNCSHYLYLLYCRPSHYPPSTFPAPIILPLIIFHSNALNFSFLNLQYAYRYCYFLPFLELCGLEIPSGGRPTVHTINCMLLYTISQYY